MDFKDKKVLVIGTGLSGVGAVQLLCAKGAEVTVLEQNEKADADAIRAKLAEAASGKDMDRVRICIGGLPADAFAAGKPDLVVPSPAVPLDSPLVASMLAADVPVISEIELGSMIEAGTVIAITGTNGKTTTTTLVGEIMKAVSGEGGQFSRTFVVGNIGRS